MNKNSASTGSTSAIAATRRTMPTQKRATVTVEVILQATANLIERDGYSSLTTNHIAAHAGVSIGTLYHYFTNREAIVNSLYEQTMARVAKQAREVIFKRVDEKMELALPGLIEAVLSIYEDNDVVLVHLLEEVPELRKAAHSLSLEMLMHSAARVYISQHHASTDPAEIETCIYFACTTFFEHVRKYILEKPEFIPREIFVEHLAEMMTFYLQHHSQPPVV